MCVVHAFYRRPFPGAQSHSKLRVRSEGQSHPPGPSEEEARPPRARRLCCGEAAGSSPRLPAVAPLHPARRLTRRTRPGGPGPSRAPGEPVPSNPSPRRRAQTLSSRPQAPVPFSLCPQLPSAPHSAGCCPSDLSPAESGPGAGVPWTRLASVWVVLSGRGGGLTWPVGAPPTLPRHMWPRDLATSWEHAWPAEGAQTLGSWQHLS